ncbi:MAG: hypothetical protein BGO21_29835 [Dyadobacter sp. 50-39]|uniref:MauE/DoxX family redox-associated membrane protein n=1 Tax=Dyadobacter sp. 50-39 TaxID=1895756 RepID=UPI00095907C2|nr:MauE/DoxX family redox-associated membrane protein [Dyadobacter sp. 50-39]OJV15208.1 MAG: hypothetical protein BGO21_29835 [Dyadobacter sp. 50-39]
MKRQNMLTIITALLIILYSYTALSKLASLQVFRTQLRMQPFPAGLIGPLAVLIPVIELIATALLLRTSTRVYGLYLSAVMMLIFTGYIGLVLLNVFEKTPCSCGGVLQQMGFGSHLLFNLFFLAISLIGIYIIHQMKGGLLSKI